MLPLTRSFCFGADFESLRDLDECSRDGYVRLSQLYAVFEG